MSDFFMYLARLEQSPHEYTALNAITRLIAERVGYTVKPRFMQAPSQWQLVTPAGGQIVFKSKGVDVDAAWQTARTKHLLPEYALSVDAALTLPLPRLHYLDMITPTSGIEDAENYVVEVYYAVSATVIAVRESKQLAYAICAAWWQVVTGETPVASLSNNGD